MDPHKQTLLHSFLQGSYLSTVCLPGNPKTLCFVHHPRFQPPLWGQSSWGFSHEMCNARVNKLFFSYESVFCQSNFTVIQLENLGWEKEKEYFSYPSLSPRSPNLVPLNTSMCKCVPRPRHKMSKAGPSLWNIGWIIKCLSRDPKSIFFESPPAQRSSTLWSSYLYTV